MPLLALPNELLLSIAECLESQRAIYALTRTNRSLYHLLEAYLYRCNVRYCESSALLWAAEHGQEGTIIKLLREGADLQKQCDYAKTLVEEEKALGGTTWRTLRFGRDFIIERHPLLLSAMRGHVAVVKLLLKQGVDPNFKDQYDRTSLSLAAMNGHMSVVEILLNSRVDLGPEDRFGDTPLSYAADNGHEAIVKRLLFELENRVYPDSTVIMRQCQTALFHAAGKRHEAIVKLLLEKEGINVNFTYVGSGQTPLSSAAREGHEAIVKLLLEKGADPNFVTHFGDTALSEAARKCHAAVVKLLLEHDCSSSPFSSPSDLDFQATGRRNALVQAVDNGHEAVVRLLLDEGGINPKFKHGYFERTPLSLAAEYGHEGLVKLFLEKGVDPDARDRWKRTALSLAAQNGHEGVVKLLLENGADPNAKDKWHRTALSWAAENRHGAIVGLLKPYTRPSTWSV